MAILSFRAAGSISAGDVVYLAGGLAQKGIGTALDQASVVGVAIDAGQVGDLVRVNSDSVYTSSLSFTPGEFQYLSVATSGAIVNYPAWQAEFNSLPVSGVYLTKVGRAVTSSNLEVEIQKPVYVIK
jgi:hypothetical protein